MTLTTLPETQVSVEHKPFNYSYYTLTVANQQGTSRKLSAYFTSKLPTAKDWGEYLKGWSDIGFELQGEPILVRALSI